MTINLINPLRVLKSGLRSGLESLNQRMQVLSDSLLIRGKNKPVVAREVAKRLSEETAINKPSIPDPFTALALDQAAADGRGRNWDDGVWHRQVDSTASDE